MAVTEMVAEAIAATPGVKEQARAYKQELVSKMFGKPKRRRGAVAAAAAFAVHESRPHDERPATLAAIPYGANVQGIGFGAKCTAGAGLDDLAVRVYVRAKIPKSKLTKKDCVPERINGIPTDVIQVGEIQAAAVLCGVSVGHVKVTAGTIGCIVVRDGKRFILSNNHILANVNDAEVKDHIIQPGKLDGGKPPHIAELTDWEPIRFDAGNEIDAAIAELLDPAGVTPELEGIGAMTDPVAEPSLYQSVRKHGRTTLHTIGVIMDPSADVRVRFGNRIAQFEDQLAVSGVNGSFADLGDSGSLVVDAVTRRPVGLLCAVSGSTTFCNPIVPVLDRFGVKIAFGV